MPKLPKKLRQPDTNWVGCAVCLNLKGKRVPATVIIRGISSCDEHTKLVAHPGFDIFQLHDRSAT